ncbi:MAG: YbaB/EbfC family nucleoid-associated protein [Kiritimatiellae bacterium]|nr:YbaB/EbfC family nucleoid-associated protein [Kiritimatiellia bacterium]
MGMFDQMKDLMKMRSESKRIQNEVQAITCEHTNGGITVVARGDMSIVSIKMAPEAYDEVKAGKPERFETMLLNVTNAALKKTRERVQAEMMKMMQGSNLGSLFGK